MGKHAYLLVVNTNLSIFKRCLELIDDSRNGVYVLLDKKPHIYHDVRQLLNSILKRVIEFDVCEQIVDVVAPKLRRY